MGPFYTKATANTIAARAVALEQMAECDGMCKLYWKGRANGPPTPSASAAPTTSVMPTEDR